MKSIPVADSLGMVLCQDITRIVPGEFKGVLFKKGHVIEEEDIEKLRDVGKEHIYVWETNPDDIHENEAAIRLAEAVGGENIVFDREIKEGKCGLSAGARGLFTLDSDKLLQSNSVEFVTIATLPNNYHVEAGAKIAGVRVVPLVVPAATIEAVERVCQDGPILHVRPYRPLKCGIVTTGSEVYNGRIEDKFGPVMREKIAFYGGECLGQTICPDDLEKITAAILAFKEQGAGLVILTGGMSVDPDDLTPSAIRASGAEVVSYGAPVQPGNMLMLAYLEGTALIGVPGCAMFFRTTAVDAMLPRIFAGVEINKKDFARMGEGGLCQSCADCRYPLCYFCRG